MNASEFSELLQRRRSVRSFLPTSLSDEAIDAILDDARHTPSWSNTRPYCVAVATGERLTRIGERYLEAFDTSITLRTGGDDLTAQQREELAAIATPDGDFATRIRYPGELRERARACGLGLYSQMGIARDDYAARTEAARRNLTFFGAPAAMWIFVHEDLLPFSAQDAGILLQTILLSAQARGIDSVPLGELATWRRPIDSEFEVPEHYKLITGLALGYKSDDAVNQFHAEHPPVVRVPEK